MKKFSTIVLGLGVFLGSFAIAHATQTLFPSGGGTGWGFPGGIQSGAIPYGNGTNPLSTTTQGTGGQILSWLNGIPKWTATTTFSSGLTYSGGNVTNTGVTSIVAGTNVTISGATGAVTINSSGGGSTGLSTTSPIASSNLLEYSSVGAGSAFGVATSTLTASSPLTGSFTQIGSGGALGCQTASGSQAGCLSSTDWTTFNGKDSFAFPWTPNTWGNATSTTLGFNNGFIDTASTTFTSSPQFNSLFAQTINPDTSPADSFNFGGRPSVTIPVPYVRPTQSNQNIAFDIFPNGTPSNGFGNSIYGVAWADICSTDIFAGPNYECLHLGKALNGASNVSSSQGGSGLIQPLELQGFGGNTGVGTDTPYAYFAIQASTTAGKPNEPLFAIASSSTDLIVNNGGQVGLGTSTPTQELSIQGNELLSGNLQVAGITATSTLTLSALGAGELYTNSSGLVGTSATTTVSCTGTVSCTAFTTFGSSPFTITGSGGAGGIGNPFTQPVAGQSATSTLMLLYGNASTTQFTATSSVYLASSAGGVNIGTTSSFGKALFVEGATSGGVAVIQRDFGSTATGNKVGTYDVRLNETTTGSLAERAGPAQTFGVENAGSSENIYADIAAVRDGADTSGALALDSYNLGVAATGIWINHIQEVGIGTTSPGYNLTLSSSTAPQLALTDGSATDVPFTARAINNELYLATSSVLTYATSTNFLLRLDSNTASTTVQHLDSLSISTSSFAGGLNLTSGCYSVNGTCISQNISNATAYKQAVTYATTAALPANTYLSGVLTEVGTGTLSVDGASPTVGQRILVKNEGTQTNNGIYTVTATGSGIAAYVLTRATDYNTSADIYPGVASYVLLGTANSDTTWALTTPAVVVLDTSNLTYAESANGNISLPISVANGGTGASTLGATQFLYGNGTSAVLSTSNFIYNPQGLAGMIGIGSSTPFAELSIGTTTQSVGTSPLFDIASSTNATLFEVFGNGNVSIGTTSPPVAGLTVATGTIFNPELTLATTTTMFIGIASSTQQLVRYGTAAMTLNISAFQLIPGEKTTIVTCNPQAVGGAITFTNLHYSGGLQPGNTTAANQCDEWFISVTSGSTSPEAVLTGMTPGVQ